ncbi:protein ANTI-SILENCING 1 isoform X2 [Abrus precatorius]|uniref:Protein ANTI-SILENCING 1 isoform X2 n=1 Tax=Abrus precatorius TaxID=3816 RepID=A0A8B8LIR5_ABRPR|nr:protein ANTI-SILENCING 1 isoform X2 [Abrus precatorius]
MVEAGEGDVLEFKWGKKRGIGGKKKDVRFYESFTYDDVDYTLFDSVFLHMDGEPEPFIGKIIKIWENADKSKKVKILWYFRPCEIRNFLEGIETLDNELFLACGEGVGLANVNPLEAIAGKCNVVSISKDSRNPQPSDKAIQMADFVFYRFFDVGKCQILDKIGDTIAGIEVKNIFNNLDSQKLVGLVKHGLDMTKVSGNHASDDAETMALLSEEKSRHLIEKPNGNCILFDTLVRENDDSKSLLGKKPTSSVGLKEARKLKNSLHTMSNDKTMPQDTVKANGACKASLVKPKSSTKLTHGSRASLEMREMAKMDDQCRNVAIDKNILRSRADSQKDDHKDVDIPIRKMNEGLMEDKAFENEKSGGSCKVSSTKKNNVKNRRLVTYDDDDNDDVESIAPSSSKDRCKRAKDSCDVEEIPSKKSKIDKKPIKLSDDKLCKESSTNSLNVEHELDFRAMEVTRRPDDRSKWFKGFPWEERMKTAYEQGKLVLLQNLDPSLTSSEVQDIIWHGFRESCTAKVIQKTAYSSPHSGQAFVIFKGKEAAELVVRRLDEGCFLMSNGRPLVGSIGVPWFPEKKPTFYGHHVVDKLRMMQMQREMKDAVSTSHCSQPNNIEYDMAVEWCLLEERANKSWRKLSQRQGEELSKLKAKLKSLTDLK